MPSCLGIDPGVRGGLAIVQADGRLVHFQAFDPQMTETEAVDSVNGALAILRQDLQGVVYMEKVGYMRGDGGKGAFTFGRIVGLIRGALITRGFDIHDVAPMMWQTKMECLTGGNKNVSKLRAQQLFPGFKITHAIADAILIAEYGRQQSS